MDWRKLQSGSDMPDSTPSKGEASTKDLAALVTGAQYVVVPSAARKPSERFMRRSLQARSKASNSERFKIAALKEKMNELVIELNDEETVFNGYRPGREAMPG